MTVSGLSSTANTQQTDWQAKMRDRKQSFDALSKALSSGDLAGAQKAFAALQQDMPAPRAQQGAANGQSATNPVSNDMDALSKALSSGDLQGAQKAFASVQQDMQARGAGHGHHRHHSRQSTQTSDSGTDATTTTFQISGTGVNVTA